MNRKFFAAIAVVALILVAAGCGGDGNDDSRTTTAATGSVEFDRAFIDAMVPHHRQAIAMAKAAGPGLTQPDLQMIADNILSSQQREIDEMLDWREEWYGSRTLNPANADSLGMSDEEMGMMGHLTSTEIAGAADVDLAFAESMIPHHEGAIEMAKRAMKEAEHQEIKDLASAIVSAQEADIVVLGKHTGMEHKMG